MWAFSWLWRIQVITRKVEASCSYKENLTTWDKNDKRIDDRIKVLTRNIVSWDIITCRFVEMDIGEFNRWDVWLAQGNRRMNVLSSYDFYWVY